MTSLYTVQSTLTLKPSAPSCFTLQNHRLLSDPYSNIQSHMTDGSGINKYIKRYGSNRSFKFPSVKRESAPSNYSFTRKSHTGNNSPV